MRAHFYGDGVLGDGLPDFNCEISEISEISHAGWKEKRASGPVAPGGWMSGLKLAAASPDLPSVGVLTYRLSLRCGVLFPKLSKLLNQEDALSAPCSPPAPAGRSTASPRHAGAGRNAADRLDPSLLMSHYGLLHPTLHADKR